MVKEDNTQINFEHMWGRVYCVKCNHYTMEITSGHHQPEDIQEQYQQWLDYHKQGMCLMEKIDQLELPLTYKQTPKEQTHESFKERISNASRRMAIMVESGRKWSRVVTHISIGLSLLFIIIYFTNCVVTSSSITWKL